MDNTRNLFSIKETINTPTGEMHNIVWKYYFPRRFLKLVSMYAIDLGWMRSGEYAIQHTEKRTSVMVSNRILPDFIKVLDYLADRYN